jgi:hypothetical protein
MKHYYVEHWNSWFVVYAKNKKIAKSEGVSRFGRGWVKDIRLATKEEIDFYIEIKGSPIVCE